MFHWLVQSSPQSPRYPCPTEYDKGNVGSGDEIVVDIVTLRTASVRCESCELLLMQKTRGLFFA